MAIAWSGVVMSIQPRVRLLRSFDQRSDTYLGYVVRLAGSVDGEPRIVRHRHWRGRARQASHRGRQRVERDRRTGSRNAQGDRRAVQDLQAQGLESRHGPSRCAAAVSWGCHRFLTCSASAAAAASPHARTPRHARVVSGGAGCRWRSSSTTGIQPESAIVKRRSATGRCRAGSTRPDPPAKFPGARV